MICPKCKLEMRELRIEGITFDQCPECGGLWAEADELAKLTGSADNLRRTFGPRNATAMACPSGCSNTLFESVYSNLDDTLVLDLCDDCGGVFLDAGELESVLKLNQRIRELFGDGTFNGPQAEPTLGFKVRRLFARFFGASTTKDP
jgi:Zn-finger nucleic acid-binding protein